MYAIRSYYEICDEHPELEEKTANLFQSISAENADEILSQVMADANIRELGVITSYSIHYTKLYESPCAELKS